MTKLLTFLFLTSILVGCASKRVSTTIFLKETDRRFTNIKGHNCLVSGYDVKPNKDSNTYRLTTYYSNCDIRETRTLEEFEVMQWAKKNKLKLQVD